MNPTPHYCTLMAFILLCTMLAGCTVNDDDYPSIIKNDPFGSSGCIDGVWNDPALFGTIFQKDHGNHTEYYKVRPGMHYFPPEPGLSVPDINDTGYPYTIQKLSRGMGVDYAIIAGSGPTLQVNGYDKKDAQTRARSFLQEVSLEDAATTEGWIRNLKESGSISETVDSEPVVTYRLYMTQVSGDFRLPEDLRMEPLSQRDRNSATSWRGPWGASFSLAVYRIDLDNGFIEISSLGDHRAILVAEPSFKDAVLMDLNDHGIGPTTFNELHEYDRSFYPSCNYSYKVLVSMDETAVQGQNFTVLILHNEEVLDLEDWTGDAGTHFFMQTWIPANDKHSPVIRVEKNGQTLASKVVNPKECYSGEISAEVEAHDGAYDIFAECA